MDNRRIGDIGTTITGKTPSTKHAEFFDGDIMFVTPVDLKQNYYLERSERYITKAGLDSIRKNSLSGKSVLVGCIGNVGDAVLVNTVCATNQQINAITNIKDEYNPEYIYYWFVENGKKLRSYAGNTVMPILNKTSFENLVIQFPNRNEQDRVVNVLSSIDKKIALNDKLIESYENLMREIYDYWFVQFDFPDENDNPYKSSGGAMVYSEELKRNIPKGWKAKPLGTILTLLKDGTHNPPKRVENGIPLLTGKMFGRTFLDYSQATYITESDYRTIHSQYSPRKSDIILTKIGTLGNVNYLRKCDIPIAIHCNSALIRFPDIMTGAFSLMYCKSEEFQKRLRATKGQSIQEFCSLENISSVQMLVPEEKVVELYNKKMEPVIRDMERISEENQLLSATRDWLLPMLMNGQIKVGD